jgi:hypothetical protein
MFPMSAVNARVCRADWAHRGTTLLAQLKFELNVSPVTLMSSTELKFIYCTVSYMPTMLHVSYIEFRTQVLASGLKFEQNLSFDRT